MTREERREAEAAIYGLSIPKTMSPSQLSHDEVERMRALVAQHDNAGGNKPGMIREFDLNKPAQGPYRFRQFPEMLYHHATRRTKTVQNREEREAAVEAGFQAEPFPIEPPVVEEEEAEEIARLDKIARQKKQKAG